MRRVSVYGAFNTRFTINVGRMASCTHTVTSRPTSTAGPNHGTTESTPVKSVGVTPNSTRSTRV